MARRNQMFWPLAAMLALAGFGCAKTVPEPGTSTEPVTTAADAATPPAPLSQADLELVAAQKTCPVGGGDLNGMGIPVKVRVKDRDVFICCEHCREPLLANPDKYLAKLDAVPSDPAASASGESASDPATTTP